MTDRYNQADQYSQVGRYGVLSAHISLSLGNYTWKGQHLQGEEHQQGLGEASYCRLCRAKTAREVVDTNILLTPSFCRHRGFVDA
jgi:hypothetical protein